MNVEMIIVFIYNLFQDKVDVAYAMFDFEAEFAKSFKTTFGDLFKKSDIDTLAENFIVTKALQAFAQHGTIEKVMHYDDQAKRLKYPKNLTRPVLG